MNYVAYTPDGRITQSGSCPADALAYQGAEGTVKMETVGTVDPNKFYVANGALVAMPERPSTHHSFDYSTKQWVPDNERAWATCRYQRDQLLAGTDWRVTKAMEMGAPMTPEWIAYRQALRDVTTQADPINIDWPVAPS